MKNLFWQIHRYVGLVLSPIFAIILITGIVIAFNAISAPEYSQQSFGNRAEQILTTVENLQNQGVQAASIYTDKDNSQLLWVNSGRQSRLTAYSLDNATAVKTAGLPPAVYGIAMGLHKQLLLGKFGSTIIEIAAWAMLCLVVIGLIFMIKPNFRRSLISWHNGLGVILLPLWLLLPITGLLMAHHISFTNNGGQSGERMKGRPETVPMVQILHTIQNQANLSNVVSVEQSRRGTNIKMDISGSLKTFQLSKEGNLKEIAPQPTNYVRSLHFGGWAGKPTRILNVSIATILLFFLLSGVYTYTKRSLKNVADKKSATNLTDNMLIIYATQTGNAEKLSHKTVKALTEKGIQTQAVSMAGITPDMLKKQSLCLFICSTAGDGEVPDSGKELLKNLSNAQLPNLKYTLLALGDSEFKNFCGGGKALDSALKQTGANEVIPIKCADGSPTRMWKEWLSEVMQLCGVTDDNSNENSSEPQGDKTVQAVLVGKNRLDNPETCIREAWELLFRLPESVTYQGGDLLMITPPNAPTPRSYSVGSSSANGDLLRLTVGMNVFTDKNGNQCKGLCSSWLIEKLNVGDEIQATLRYTDFHIENNDNPVIMVAAGVGIAPMIGFLTQLQKRPRPAWLFFGNSNRNGGYHYQNQWEQALSNGVLTHINTAFTEEHKGYYVQDEFFRKGGEVFDWIMNNNAVLYVCGKTNTVGKGINDALIEIIKAHGKISRSQAEDTVNKLKADNRIRMDLFG